LWVQKENHYNPLLTESKKLPRIRAVIFGLFSSYSLFKYISLWVLRLTIDSWKNSGITLFGLSGQDLRSLEKLYSLYSIQHIRHRKRSKNSVVYIQKKSDYIQNNPSDKTDRFLIFLPRETIKFRAKSHNCVCTDIEFQIIYINK